MLERAAEATSDPRVEYRRADLEELEQSDIGTERFDVAYSSLAFHYVADLDRLLRVVHDALVPGGGLVFSIEHPIYMAPREPGWVRDAEGRVSWPVDSYHAEGARDAAWLGSTVRKYHRTIGTTLNTLIQRGFVIDHVQEFGPTAEQVASQPDLASERERPGFLLVAAHRR